MLANITGKHIPDILDCIANLSSDEVFTPPAMANRLLNLLPNDIWKDPNIKILDPGCKSGIFLRESAKRLMIGLADLIPDEEKRRNHIFKNMLYGIAITELTGWIARRTLYYTKDPSNEKSIIKFDSKQGNILYQRSEHEYKKGSCIHCGSSDDMSERGEDLENHAYQFIHKEDIFKMKFDVIIGNPPYQTQDGGHGASASPLYHKFIEQAVKLNPKYISMIIPSRWFAGGKGLDEFRETMLKDKRISHLVDFTNASDCFPGVKIEGGVCYFLWDKNYSGPCKVTNIIGGEEVSTDIRELNSYDVFVRLNQSISILEKVKVKNEVTFEKFVASRKPFGLATNFKEFKKEPFTNSVKLYYRDGQIGYVDPKKILLNQHWFDKYKVLLSVGYGLGNSLPTQVTGKPFVTDKNSCCTETYLVCSTFDKKEEALNLEQYMKTKFFRFLIYLRKNTQHLSKERFTFVPYLDTKTSWTDEMLYKRYDLSKKEIALIDSLIREI